MEELEMNCRYINIQTNWPDYNNFIFRKRKMKAELKKLKGTSIKTIIGEITLREYYRLDESQYDQIYFKTSGVQGICKIYSLTQPASTQRFRNQMQQYNDRPLTMMYNRIHCQQVKIKKADYGLVMFMKLDKEPSLRQCMSTLPGYERMKLTITLIQLLQQLQENKKIYCNIRPSNIFKLSQGFKIINSEFLRSEGQRANIDSFMLETIQNNWQYWPTEVSDPYSNQKFDYSLDVYAVGCILYELVAGRYPFESKLSANNAQYTKLQGKNLISKIAQSFIGPSQKRRAVNLKDLLKKLRQSNSQIKPSNVADISMQQRNRKGSNNGGIFDNISNVFSKMMNDSEGWFLNFVQDNEEAPNEKYLDNILTKMYKKEEKCDKLSSIIYKFVSNNQNKTNSILKTLLIIGHFVRKGPEATLASFLPNVNSIKSSFPTSKEIQSLCLLLEKKIEVNDKVKKMMTGNFHIYEITNNFKKVTIQDLATIISYLQHLIVYVENMVRLDNSQLSQSIINFSCDQIYDIVSITIISIISIRKDNQLQLRNDNIKELQPIEKILNVSLKKLSNLSNFISAHAIYSLEGEYIPYQEQIMLKSNPYYTSLQFFYNTSRSYKGLTIPVDYAQMFSSNYNREDKKNAHSANKQIVNKEFKPYVFDNQNAKGYFEEDNNSDQDGQFNRSNRAILELNQKKSSVGSPPIKNNSNSRNTGNYQIVQIIKVEGQLKNGHKDKVGQNMPRSLQPDSKKNQSSHEKNQKSTKQEVTISFQQFGNITKVKNSTSPSKGFNEFNFFQEEKKQHHLKKPPLPEKKDSSKTTQSKLNKSSFIEFDQFFDKSQSKKNIQFTQITTIKVQPNFDAFNSFLAQPAKKPAQPQNPLVKKILSGLKLKQLKDLLQSNKKYIIDFKQLKTIKVIGSGSAGEVYFGQYKEEDVAIKKVKAKENPNALKEFQRQLVTYIKIKKNPHLVSLVGLSEDNGNFYLITEFCSSGSLFDLLHKRKIDVVISWKQRLNFAIQIAQGMSFLHAMKPIIIHRDLKSLNVFVTRVNNNWKMKVADFGLSRSPQADMMTTQLGTIHWMAPELLQGKQYSFKVDVYSYGVLLWQILSRTTPYSNLQNPMAILKYVVIDRKRPNMQSIPKECPAQLITVMQKCWAHDPNDRPTFPEIIKALKMINI